MLSNLTESDPNTIYSIVELLGEGSYGSVYKGVSFENGDEVAVKIIPYDSAEEVETIAGEIEFLKKLSSPFVVSYVSSYKFGSELWIIMEYCGGGSICDIHEARQRTLEEYYLRAVVAYTVLGLYHLHSQRCIHRDVKAGNILLTTGGQAKLADFGVSVQLTHLNQKRRTVIGTPYWMAPEVIQEISYDSKADIWSLGITILEAAEGYPPLYDVHPMRAIFMIPMKPPPRFQDPFLWSSDMIHFLERCLVKTPDTRASSEELLHHPWISAEIQEVHTNGNIYILKELVESNWDDIEGARNARMSGLVPPSGKQGAPALRNRVKEKLDSTKLSLKMNSLHHNNSGTMIRTPDKTLDHSIDVPMNLRQNKNISNNSTSSSSVPSVANAYLESIKKGSSNISSKLNDKNGPSQVFLAARSNREKLPLPPFLAAQQRSGTLKSPPPPQKKGDSKRVIDKPSMDLGGGLSVPSLSRDTSLDQYATLHRVPTGKSSVSDQPLNTQSNSMSGSNIVYEDVDNDDDTPGMSIDKIESDSIRLKNMIVVSETIPEYEDLTSFKDRMIYRNTDPTEVYDFMQLLGEGSYGLVYKGECLPISEEVAIKVLPCFNYNNIGEEIEIMKKLNNPFIVPLYQGFIFNKELWIVMEFCQGGSVCDLIRYGKKPLDESEVIGIVATCVIALNYIHSSLVIHRDMKAGNILLTRDGKAKIADFGVSAVLSHAKEMRSTLIGTPFWMAPEVIQEYDYDAMVDIWGLGITLIEMVEGEPPHFDLHPMRAVFVIPLNPSPTFTNPSLWSSEMREFLSLCVSKNPDERATTQELAEHDWIKSTLGLVAMNKGLAKSRDLVSRNWNAIELYREQRVLKRGNLRPLSDAHDTPRAPMNDVIYEDNYESYSPPPLVSQNDAPVYDETQEEKDSSDSLMFGNNGKKRENSRSPPSRRSSVSPMKNSIGNAMYATPDSPETASRNRRSLFTASPSVPTSAPRAPSVTSQPSVASPKYQFSLIRDVVADVQMESTRRISRPECLDNIKFLQSQYDIDRERLEMAYEIAKSRQVYTKEFTFEADNRSEIDSEQGYYSEPMFNQSNAPVNRNNSNDSSRRPPHNNGFTSLKILKYFRKHWKAQLISSDAKQNAINYKNIHCLEAVAKLESAFHAANVFDVQNQRDLDALCTEYEDRIIDLEGISMKK